MTARTGRGAAVIVVVNRQVLSITRGHDTRNWTLPGGNVEPGETFEQGARRELLEETGVDAAWAELSPVWSTERPGSSSVIYLARGHLVLPRRLRSQPFEGFVDWKEPRALLAPTCRYRENNALAFSRIGLI
jgi:8-oxo-dGTP pyrophosphatase MutT (NUDIX family)